MRRVLFILGELEDADVNWMVEAGVRQPVDRDEVLVEQGREIDALYFVLRGKFAVSIARPANEVVARLGVGEVVGELSYLDSRPPSATLTAEEDSLVLAIPRRLLTEKLSKDAWFAARFYKALGVFLADRLRSTTSRLAYGEGADELDEDIEAEGEMSPELLDNLELAGARFDWILKQMLEG